MDPRRGMDSIVIPLDTGVARKVTIMCHSTSAMEIEADYRRRSLLADAARVRLVAGLDKPSRSTTRLYLHALGNVTAGAFVSIAGFCSRRAATDLTTSAQ